MIIFKTKRFTLLISNFLFFLLFLSLGPLFLCLTTNQRFLMNWELINVSSMRIELTLILDLYGTLFRTTVLLISSSVVTFRINYISEDKTIKRFIIVVLLFIFSINLLIYIPNIVTLLLGWDGLGIVSFILVIYYQNPRSLAAGMITALANRIGDVVLIISIAWITVQGHWRIITIFESSYRNILTLIILVGAITKRAQIPFSRWLPAAMAAPTPVSALVHSSTLVTAGVFLLVRFYFFLEKTYWFNRTCLAIASITCLMAGVCAIQEFDIKKIIALSTLRQLGVIITRIGLGAVNVAYFHIVTHALFKALLFICAGNVIHQHGGSQDIRFMGNLWFSLPITSSCLSVANLALCGLPFIAGFYSKDLILEIFFINNESLLILSVIIIRTLFTLMYSVRLSFFVIWGEHKKTPLYGTGDEDKNVNLSEQILSAGAIFGGALLSWALFSNPSTIVLTMSQKLFIIIFLGLTLLMIFFFEKYFYYKNSIFMFKIRNLVINRLRSIWFLSLLFGKSSSYVGLTARFFFTKVSDQGWRELFGGQGAFLRSKSLFKEVKEAQSQAVTLFLFISFLIVLILILLI